jgi:hypothetical protein
VDFFMVSANEFTFVEFNAFGQPVGEGFAITSGLGDSLKMQGENFLAGPYSAELRIVHNSLMEGRLYNAFGVAVGPLRLVR